MEPCIFHVDVDAFFASVEQVRAPFLRGRPVVVGSGVIASCSYEARRFGLHAGLPLHEARKRCPKAVFLEGNAQVYRAFAERVWELCRELSPSVDTLLDDAYLDMTGTRPLYPGPCAAAAYLQARIRKETGLSVTVGIGPSRVVARMAGAARKPGGIGYVPAEEVPAFLEGMPVEALPGVGRKRAEKLHRLGIRFVGELRRLPPEGMEALFGREGAVLHARSRGRDGRALLRSEIPRSISRETTFHRATTDPEEIRGMVHYLVERAMRALRALGLRSRTVGVRIAYEDGAPAAARRTLPPFDLEGPAFRAAMELLGRVHRRRVALRRVGVVLENFLPGDRVQAALFEDPEGARRERLARALDAVRARFGFRSITAGPSTALLGRLRRNRHGYVLRTPSLTK